MSILIISPNRDPQKWIDTLTVQEPDLEIEVYPDVKHKEKVEFVLAWKHPHGIFKEYPNLKVIASMGAGIDHIITDPEIPRDVKITRVIDEQLTEDMSVFVLSLCLEHLRNLSFHHCSKEWEPKTYKRPETMKVGIMGLGVLGVAVAEKLIRNKFDVFGWRKNKQEILGVNTFYGNDQLDDFLKNSDILVCLLPLTSETENILDRELFQKLPKDAYLINVARGNHLVEEDLLEMTDNGHLSGASLDVFRQEPLPKEHSFWRHQKIKITPHIASVTNPKTVVPQLLENFRNMKNNSPLNHLVSREKEY